MKKVIVTFVAGAVLATAGSVYAEDIKSLVGQTKKIQAEVSVKVDGKKADKTGIIIDGTTYLPVRSISNALDMNVSYSKTEVELTSKGVSTLEPTTETPSETKQMSQEDIDAIKSSEEQIVLAEQRIVDLQSKIKIVEGEIASEQKKYDEASNDEAKKYHDANMKVLNSDKSSLADSLKAARDSIESQRAFIDKIKKKYE